MFGLFALVVLLHVAVNAYDAQGDDDNGYHNGYSKNPRGDAAIVVVVKLATQRIRSPIGLAIGVSHGQIPEGCHLSRIGCSDAETCAIVKRHCDLLAIGAIVAARL